jgi:hypothetical protein
VTGSAKLNSKKERIDGDTISFVEIASIQDREIRIAIPASSRADGNEIKFTREVGDFGKAEIVAKREQTRPPQRRQPQRASGSKPAKSEPVKDADGNVWLADQGFEGGQNHRTPDIQIANTKSPIFTGRSTTAWIPFVACAQWEVRIETAFRRNLRGHYRAWPTRILFQRPGTRVQRLRRLGQAGGFLKAYVETVPSRVTDGKIKVTFTPQGREPQICAIEIIPQSGENQRGGSRPYASGRLPLPPIPRSAPSVPSRTHHSEN